MRIVASIILIAAIAIVAWFFRDTWRSPSRPAIASSSRSIPAPEAPEVPAPPVIPSASAPETTQAATQATAQAATQAATQATTPVLNTPTKIEQQAKKYVAKLTKPDPLPIQVEKADNFVTSDQLFSLIPKSASRQTTVAKIIADKSLAPETPITIIRKVEQIQRVSPEKLIAASAGNLDAPVKLLVDDQVIISTVKQALQAASKTPDLAIDIVTDVEYFEQTTPAELSAEIKDGASLKSETIIHVITKPHGLEAASMGDLLRTRESGIITATVPGQLKQDEDDLFYVRTVRVGDTQGIWGIVQEGIIKNFARGMAIRRGREINTYQVEIPRLSDEKINGSASSFLGRLIFRKSNESYVFNFRQNRMGRNPDRIFPGQEIVIINFKPEELIGIYKHFVAQHG